MYDIKYSEYDVINIVVAMTYKHWFDVIYSACGVVQAVGVISYIHRVWYHQSSGSDYTDSVGVMSDTVVVLSLLYHMRCHIC